MIWPLLHPFVKMPFPPVTRVSVLAPVSLNAWSPMAGNISGFQPSSSDNTLLISSTRVAADRWTLQPGSGAIRRTIHPVVEGVSTHPARLIPECWRQFPAGAHNAITDVPGVRVGHVSMNRNQPVAIRTGVTAIVTDPLLPSSSPPSYYKEGMNPANTGFRASAAVLNGNGELTGMGPLVSAGILNSPIILTNTQAVGVAHQGVFQWFARHYPGAWSGQLPVVGECWDGFFSAIDDPVLKPEDTVDAIDAARSGPVGQGRTGAGTGMRSFEMHAGIGSASRQLVLNGHTYTIGVLVNTNHSRLERLNPLLRGALERHFGTPLEEIRRRDNEDKAIRRANAPVPPVTRQGSIMVIIATDLPLDSQALHQLAERAGLGIGNTGSVMATTSGDFAVAFSTANPVPLGEDAPSILSGESVHPDALSPVFQATVEAVTEAQLNAITAAHSRSPSGNETSPMEKSSLPLPVFASSLLLRKPAIGLSF